MRELIDRNELMKFPIRYDHYDIENGNIHFVNGIESVLEYALMMTIVVPEPMVLCRECRKRNTEQCPVLEWKETDSRSRACSFGERIEQEGGD